MFGSAEAGGLFRTLRARSVPGRWHLLRGWHTARRASGRRRTSPVQGYGLYGAVLSGRKAVQQMDFSATSGQGACREDGISPGADTLPGGFPGSGRTSPVQGHSLYGAVLPDRKAVRLMDFPHPGAGVYREDGIFSGAGTLSGGFPGSGKDSPLYGQYRPKTNTPPHRPGRAAGVFSCTGTGRIRLRHRATWRRWGSRERRLPKPGRQ